MSTSNSIQIRDKQGNPLYPITDKSLVTGLQDVPFESYIVAWDGSSAPTVANIPAGVVVNYNSTDYTGTLAASVNTAPYLYLVASASQQGEYDRYITTKSGSSFVWTALGSTAPVSPVIADNLTTNDASKALSAKQGKILGESVEELDLEVHNLSGKYYGIFEDAESLPEGDAVGYAFVGTEDPFAIYNFNGEEWTDSGATVDGITGEPGVGFSSVSTPTPYDGTVIITLSNGDTITLDLNHNHPAYYSKVLGGAQPVGGFEPDVVYSLGTLSGTITFSIASPVTGNVNHYFWMFDTGVSAPTITWPTGITWADGSAPTVAASKHYEVSILGGIAYYSEV